MSKEEQVRPAAPAAPTTADESDDDLLLQVNLRLKLDEIAELKASTLRLKAQRKPTRSEL